MKKITLILCFIHFALTSSYGQRYDTQAKIKAVFIYNFTKYIEWPPEKVKGDFTIGIVGSPAAISSLEKVMSTKKIGYQPLQIRGITLKELASTKKIKDCHILYISKNTAEQHLHEISAKLKGLPTLIITEKEGLITKGSGINFVVRKNKIEFELNKSLIKTHNLQIASYLSNLACVVK